MGMSITAMAKQLLVCSLSASSAVRVGGITSNSSHGVAISRYITTSTKSKSNNPDKRKKEKSKAAAGVKEKRRTRSDKDYDFDTIEGCGLFSSSSTLSSSSHIPVMLGEVLDVFSSSSSSSSSEQSLRPLRSFVDCTLGAAGHSSAIIQAHPELQLFIGMDVDPLALEKARAQIHAVLHANSFTSSSYFKVHTLLKNFKYIKSVLSKVDETLLNSGVDGILMDLGMSSMQVNNAERGFSFLGNGPLDMRMDPQASLKAEDILNLWPDTELGRVLREYGEESNWRLLQNKIVQARLCGGLHSTGELVDLIKNVIPPGTRGGRQGWLKTATRVFQALRIAVNDELRTLEDSLYACFDCLAPGGRLAVISFHSLEDRIVKQTFLDIIECNREDGDGCEEERGRRDLRKIRSDNDEKEKWIRQMIQGWNGTILTKRPITPSEDEERLNHRCRSAKLRVIQKVED